MKKPRKHLLAKRELWTASKRGCPTGYGVTPELAFNDSVNRRRKSVETATEHRNYIDMLIANAEQHLKQRMAASYEENRLLQRALNDQIAQTKSLAAQLRDKQRNASNHLASARREDSAAIWVATAMAYFGTTDVKEALQKAIESGLTIDESHLKAIAHVQFLVDGWIKHFTDKQKA